MKRPWTFGKELAGRLSGPVAGGIVGAAASGPTGLALGAAGPLVAELLTMAREHSWSEMARACDDTGTPFDEAIQLLTVSEGGPELLVRALDAAQWTTYEPKLLALGRSLAVGANDAARIDAELLLVAAVHDVQPAHLRLLAVLSGVPAETQAIAGVPVAELRVGQPPWSKVQLEGADPALDGDTVDVLVGLLERHGLARAVQPASGGMTFHGGPTSPRWAITTQGRLLLERAHERSTV